MKYIINRKFPFIHRVEQKYEWVREVPGVTQTQIQESVSDWGRKFEQENNPNFSLRANTLATIRIYPGETCRFYAEKMGIEQKRLSSTLSDMAKVGLITSSERYFGHRWIKIWRVV